MSKTNLIVISSDYHIRRVKHIFSRVFNLKIEYMKTNIKNIIDIDYQTILRKEEKILKKFRSEFNYAENGNSKSFYENIKQNHPFYNGDIYPKIFKYEKNQKLINKTNCKMRILILFLYPEKITGYIKIPYNDEFLLKQEKVDLSLIKKIELNLLFLMVIDIKLQKKF